MQCNKCRVTLADNDKYCYSCGEKVNKATKKMNQIDTQYSDIDRSDKSTTVLLFVSLISCGLPSLIIAVIAIIKSNSILKYAQSDNLIAARAVKHMADTLTKAGWIIYICHIICALIALILYINLLFR